MGKILIIHPDSIVLDHFRAILESDGHWVIASLNSGETANRVLSHRPDLVLLHLAPEHESELIPQLRKIRLGPAVPLVFLTSRSAPEDISKPPISLEADGLLSTDPLVPAEISSTIHNLLERPPGKKGAKRFLRYGHLELDRETRAARLGIALATDLPKKLFDLLWLLTKRATESKEISPRGLLISRLWKARVRDREVDVTISRLKSRVPFLAPYIETIPGKGYRFSLPTLARQEGLAKK